MFYFIPSWYDDEYSFRKSTPLWYRIFDTISFDDTVNQIKMFQSSGEASKLLLLAYQPQLRYYLHKEGLLTTSYWSFFDDVQNIQDEFVKPLNFKDLNWPQGVKFIYTPFLVVAHYQGSKLADIEFAENGNLLLITWFDNEQIKWVYFFDDRGFVSSIKYYDNGHPTHQDYLNSAGVWQIREHLKEPNYYLEISPIADHNFKQAFYVSWESLIVERLELLKKSLIKNEDVLVISSHMSHNALLAEVFVDNPKIYSFFEGRFDFNNTSALIHVAKEADLMVVDSQHLEEDLTSVLGRLGLNSIPLSRVTPFDTRLRLGRSQTVKELIIYCLIDGLSDPEWQYLSTYLLDYMAENKLVELKLISYENADRLKLVQQDLEERIYKSYDLERFMSPKEGSSENLLDEDVELELSAINLQHFNNENQIIQALDTARLVLDWGARPHLYTQIASLSAGVPQINRIQTDYVNDRENGWVLPNLVDLPKALDFYFDGLTNWNQSLVYSVRKMGEYTSGEIIGKWKELLASQNGT